MKRIATISLVVGVAFIANLSAQKGAAANPTAVSATAPATTPASRPVCGYKAVEHKPLPADAIEVKEAGVCDQAGKTYMLTRDISSATSTMFLAAGVTLDLNGYTITYADGKYEHVPNYGFEDGLKGWDVSKAPGAKVIPSAAHPMVGEKILELKAGDEIVSAYINLPSPTAPTTRCARWRPRR